MADGKAASSRRPAGLGRGLSALLGEVQREAPVADTAADDSDRPVRLIPVGSIAPHPEQPRRHFDEAALGELADSIALRGVIQPIVVRPQPDGRFQIVAGERRWRAAQRAQLHEVPAIVRDFSEAETLEIALIENIQREDLNAVEEAQAYRKLIDQFGHTQDALARLVHKSRSHVANLLRLLDLPAPILAHVVQGDLSMGHARALIGAPDADRLADRVAAEGLSVRQTEALARKAKGTGGGAPPTSATGAAADADLAALEAQLGDLLGLKVRVAHGGAGNGTMTITYSTLDQLDMICQRLTGERI